MTVVTGVVSDPEAAPVKGAEVAVSLLTFGGMPGFHEGEDCGGVATVITGVDGAYSFDLVPNDEIVPTGSVYIVSEVHPSGRTHKFKIVVPSFGGPYTAQELLVPPDTTPEQPAFVGPAGPQGVQGPQGIQGPAGAVGPAGLTWRGTWAAETAYALNDAVSHVGLNAIASSYFCVQADTGTAPSEGSSNAVWALLAQEGPQGPQGIQGPPGEGGGGGGTAGSSLELVNNGYVTHSRFGPITSVGLGPGLVRTSIFYQPAAMTLTHLGWPSDATVATPGQVTHAYLALYEIDGSGTTFNLIAQTANTPLMGSTAHTLYKIAVVTPVALIAGKKYMFMPFFAGSGYNIGLTGVSMGGPNSLLYSPGLGAQAIGTAGATTPPATVGATAGSSSYAPIGFIFSS